ncbi:hypothetical protein TNCV_1671011 [Trichonephila clavipes]|nr:hypothetical protein TNCV_1671011 [Trichonephila clavipes]
MEWQKCHTCNKSFTGIVSFKEHEASEKHKRRVKAQKQNNTENSKPHFKSYKKCLECNKIFNGPVPYKQHLKSNLHKKKIKIKPLKKVEIDSKLPASKKRNSAKSTKGNSAKSIKDNSEKSMKRNSETGSIPSDAHILRYSHPKKVRNVQIKARDRKLKFSFVIEF